MKTIQSNNERIGDWMLSFKGRQLWPLDIRPEDIDIEEVAHSLSNICRFGGHCREFYSVAQHSVLVAACAPYEYRKVALLHDAAEAYIGDMVRPLKVNMAMFQEIESKIWNSVSKAFNIEPILPQEVDIADARVLLAEKRDLCDNSGGHIWKFPQCRFPDLRSYPLRPIQPLTPKEAEKLFLLVWMNHE